MAAVPETAKGRFFPPLILFLMTFVVYAGCFRHGFLTTWDDNVYVTGNAAIRGFTLDHIRAAFTSYFVGNYAPLHLVSYMLDYALWGLDPAGFIFSNLLLHSLNGVLFYFIALRLLQDRVSAFLASFLFLFHPVQVESVAWVSQRKTVLAMTFFLAALHLYIRYRSAERPTRRWLYLLSIAAFTCSLLTKSITVILPLALILYDLCFVPRESRRLFLIDKVPYIVVAVATAALVMVSQSPESGGGRIPVPEQPLSLLFTMLPIYARYLGLVFWPDNLSSSYEVMVRHSIDVTVLLSALLLLLLMAGTGMLYRSRRRMFFGAALFFLGLLPVSQVVPIATLINDRYLYFPLLGAALCLGGSSSLLSRHRKEMWGKTAILIGAVILLLLPFLSLNRTAAWTSDVTLWTDATAKGPGNSFAWMELGSAHHKAGDLDSSLICYRRALALQPHDFTVLKNIALTHMKKREFDEAMFYLKQLTEYYPGYSGAYEDMALIRKIAGGTAVSTADDSN